MMKNIKDIGRLGLIVVVIGAAVGSLYVDWVVKRRVLSKSI